MGRADRRPARVIVRVMMVMMVRRCAETPPLAGAAVPIRRSELNAIGRKDQAVAAERTSNISSRGVPCRATSSLSWLR